MTVSRRNLMQAGAAAALAGPAPAASVPAIYQRLGVRTIINAVGTLTTLSGSLTPPEVKRAMEEASRSFVRIHELQEKAGRRLAELTPKRRLSPRVRPRRKVSDFRAISH